MRNQSGFSLIELIIIILLVAILAVFAVDGINSANIAHNERSASATLKGFVTAQTNFHGADCDGNGKKDYYIGDVSGLYRMCTPAVSAATVEPIKLIEISVAQADGRPIQTLTTSGDVVMGAITRTFRSMQSGFSPKEYYVFQVVEEYEATGAVATSYNEADQRHTERFGFITYPNVYGRGGKKIFIVNESGSVFAKDPNGSILQSGSPSNGDARLNATYRIFPVKPYAGKFDKPD